MFLQSLTSRLKTSHILLAIFAVALLVRFLYFPDNIYFGFDQARDAYESQNIYTNGDLKLIGPSTAKEGLFHGPAYWYLIGPPYLLGGGSPEIPALFLSVLNAAGVFLVFLVGKALFDKSIGLLASLLYASSFEQTQYALYFGNPAPAVLTILLFYLGLALFLIRGFWWGVPVALLGLGLSVQFEFFLIYLALVFLVFVALFRRKFLGFLKPGNLVVSIASILLSLGTFLVADVRYGWRSFYTLLSIQATVGGRTDSFARSLLVYLERLGLHAQHNFFTFDQQAAQFALFGFAGIIVVMLFKLKVKSASLIFLLVWILSTSLLLGFGTPNLYYSNIGLSAGMLLLVSLLLHRLYLKLPVLAVLLGTVIILGNLKLVLQQNPKGIINDIYVQEGMLLAHEKVVIDYIYQTALGKPVVVSASTMPLKINTTWAYLFEWYGKSKYGYLPYWAGEVAAGYPGSTSLPTWQSQERDYVMFSIIEPTRGVRQAFIDQFLESQEQYGPVLEEKRFGDSAQAQLVVQRRR